MPTIGFTALRDFDIETDLRFPVEIGFVIGRRSRDKDIPVRRTTCKVNPINDVVLRFAKERLCIPRRNNELFWFSIDHKLTVLGGDFDFANPRSYGLFIPGVDGILNPLNPEENYSANEIITQFPRRICRFLKSEPFEGGRVIYCQRRYETVKKELGSGSRVYLITDPKQLSAIPFKSLEYFCFQNGGYGPGMSRWSRCSYVK